jgi:hypothetical protein
MKDSNKNKVGILDINYDTGRANWGPQLRDLLGVRAKTLRPGCPARQEVEFRIVDAAGEVRWLCAEVRVEFRTTGSHVGAVVIDVTRVHLEASGCVAGQPSCYPIAACFPNR